MKLKQLLFLFAFTAISVNAQMLISGVVDGPLSGGTPKAIEFYVYEDIADLSIFGFGSANNGGGTDGQEFTFPAISVPSGSFLYVASESSKFNDFFGFNPDYTSGAASVNGDDAIELFKNSNVIDVFGDINTDGTGEPWEYLDGWAYRNNETGPDGSTFVLANWSFSGKNALDGETSNSTASTPFPIGTFSYGGTPTIPDAPVATTATNIGHNSFTANWNSSTGATSYFLDVSTLSDFSTFVTGFENLNVGNVTEYGVTNLTPESVYFYRVRASNSEGTSGNSNVISVETTALPATIVEFANATGSVLETAGTYNVVVSITNPDLANATNVDVVLTSGDQSNINGFTSETVTFPAGSSEDQIVTLTIIEDDDSDNESLTFTLQNATGGNNVSIGTQATFDLTIKESAGGDYYDNIDPTLSTFIDDLKNRIRNPYTWVPYGQYDETILANYESIDNGDGTRSVFCVYSNFEHVYSGTFSWLPFSREHTFCHSWMPTHPANSPVERDEYSDQHHLFPTHQDSANAVRSNHPLGIVSNATDIFGEAKFGTDANGKEVYEPRDPHKGDAARAILYMMIRYDDIDGYDWGLDAVNAASGKDQDLDVLLTWHQQDPPDTWEIERNDYIESIQGNRNPFVDHPEYVNYIDFHTIEYISNELFFSEYIEGSSNNKALEIFNNTGASIDLSALDYKVQLYRNGSQTVSSTINLTGTIADGDVFVLSNPSADPLILAVTDQTSGSVNFNGDDAIALVKGNALVDVIGQIGVDPGSEWGTGDISTANNTIRRKSSIGIGDPDGSDVFDPSIEWKGYAIDEFSGLGTHAINAGPPTITNITQAPKIPLETENTTVTADVSDDESVGLVKLIYKIDGGTEQEINMSLSSGSTYEASIPNVAYTNGNLLEYWVYAEDGDGSFKTSSHNKVFIGTTPIEKVKLVNANGELEHINTYVRVTGVATVESGLFSPTSLDVYVQDNTAGINIYKSSSMTTIIRGNSYTVEGMLAQYKGKAEIIPDDLSTDITDNGTSTLPKAVILKTNALPDPQVLTINGALATPENYEGMLIGIQHVSKNGGDSWPVADNNANVQITDNGGTDNLTLRIDKDTEIDGTPEPAWPKDIVGIFNQYDNSAPYNSGYQIQPRDLDDIKNDGALPVELVTFSVNVHENIVNLNWETATEVNNYGFEIERQKSEEGDQIAEWSNIGFVKGHGNSNSPKIYSFEDDLSNLSGSFKYRLKQIDVDGKFKYSPTIEVEIGIPAKFEVSQNYPNPFNPSTTISFSLPETQQVTVEVFNLLGQVIKTLVNEKLNAGKYNYEFDASNLSSGNYIYRVIAGKNVRIRKMMLLK